MYNLNNVFGGLYGEAYLYEKDIEKLKDLLYQILVKAQKHNPGVVEYLNSFNNSEGIQSYQKFQGIIKYFKENEYSKDNHDQFISNIDKALEYLGNMERELTKSFKSGLEYVPIFSKKDSDIIKFKADENKSKEKIKNLRDLLEKIKVKINFDQKMQVQSDVAKQAESPIIEKKNQAESPIIEKKNQAESPIIEKENIKVEKQSQSKDRKFETIVKHAIAGAALGATISATLALKAIIPLAALSCIPVIGQTIAAGGVVGIGTFIAVCTVIGAIAGAVTGAGIFSCKSKRSKKDAYNNAFVVGGSTKDKGKEQEIPHAMSLRS